MTVDDIQILYYPCPGLADTPILDCDFEQDTCAWWNVAPHALYLEDDNMDWVRRSAVSGGSSLSGPPSDNTLGSDVGYYLLMEATGRADAMAVLASQPLPANTSYCLSWYTYSPKQDEAQMKVHYHDLVTSEVGDVCNIWTCVFDGAGDKWEQHHVPLNHKNPYNLYLIGSLGATAKVPLSVDDILLEKGDCPPDPSATFTCQDGSTVPSDAVCDMKRDCPDGSDELECGSCIFETGECGWKQKGSTDYYWHLQDGSEACEDTDCTGGDHTTQDADGNHTQDMGHFMYLKHTDAEPNGASVFEGPSMNNVFSSCMFKFWYISTGMMTPIDVKMNHKEEEVLVCRTYDWEGTNDWMQSTCYVGRRADTFNFQMVSQLHSSDFGQLIAVDDFTLEGCSFPRPSPDLCGEDMFTCSNG